MRLLVQGWMLPYQLCLLFAIEGRHANPNIHVLLDAYTIKGLQPGQIKYLRALSHLCSTYDYGVTFERGTCLYFGDRSKVYISGTASIDKEGNIMHAGDIVGQVHRTWENVEALLKEADCTFEDLMQIIVYLRDMADYQCVTKMFDEKFNQIPKVIVLAPVCRPGWLVEMECIASKIKLNKTFKDL
jgi:Putative translation initiation inhibitor, yjgF family